MPPVSPYRPRYHVTPPQNWMNDPNGLLYHAGEYHLYYQHNPHGTAWGHMSWSHAVSPNLVHWTHMPVAIPENPDAGYTIFSGSAVLDVENTSGLGTPERAPIVAIYTADRRGDTRRQDVHIAYSLDRGRTFEEYAGNPVLRVDDPKFGGPKVFWHAESGQWIMVNILHLGQGMIAIYGSQDLKIWRLLSEFQAADEAPGTWECPDLFSLRVDGDPAKILWVLKVNCTGPGPASRYFLGQFNGERFTQTGPTLRPRPDNDSLYAEVTYNGLPEADGRRLLFGWLRQAPSEARSWTGAQSLPREVTLRTIQGRLELCQQPARELEYLRRHHRVLTDHAIVGELTLVPEAGIEAGACELALEAEVGDAAELDLHLSAHGGAMVTVGYDVRAGLLFVDGAGESRQAVPWAPAAGRIVWRVFVDQTVVEVYAGQGERVISSVITPDAVVERVALDAQGGVAHLVKLEAWSLDSALLTTPW